jgi:hypothetical protein
LSTQVKSDIQSLSADSIIASIQCRDLKGFVLFSIPKVANLNPRALKAISKEVRKHGYVKSADLTGSDNLLVAPNARNLRKGSMSYKGFKAAIKKLIANALVYEIHRSQTAALATRPTLTSPKKPGYVNDKTKRVPAVVPLTS